MDNKPELLSPAGDMEKLIMSVLYGADAVYMAGNEFGMRASAGNFDSESLEKAIDFCHSRGVRCYITCNTLPRENELQRLPAFLEQLSAAGADALIIADFGVFTMAKKYAPDIPVHVSTQFGVTNSASASALYEMGADTVVLARELSIREIAEIRSNTPSGLKLEAFVHGAMCVSFSGRCLISNYLTGRDANRGECAQPCRWKYSLCEEKRPGEYFDVIEDNGTYLYNSKDMCMIEHIPDLIDAGVSSLKIEGRMKSSYYTAVVTNAYRNVIDEISAGYEPDRVWFEEVNKVSHRPYSTGFYYGYPGQHYSDASYTSTSDVMAVVGSCDEEGNAVLIQRNKFSTGDTLELLVPGKKPVEFTAGVMKNDEGEIIKDTPHATMKIYIKLPFCAPENSIIRRSR